jgi:hypothetical protein
MPLSVQSLRVALLTLAITAWTITPAAAQSSQNATDSTAALHRGKAKILAGAIMMGVGAVVVPVTAARDGGSDGAAFGTGLLLMGTGRALVWWGVQQQRHALKSNTSVGVIVGRSSGIQIRRS